MTTTQKLSAKKTQAIRDFIDANYGAQCEIMRRFEKATGQPVQSSNFVRWFHRDPKKRIQPQLGTYCLIQQIVCRMVEEQWSLTR